MTINNFLQNRESVREFRNKSVSRDKLATIKSMIKDLIVDEEMEHIGLKLHENGKAIVAKLEGKAGYAGVMIESPHYIAIDLKDTDEKTLIDTGYYTEKLVTEIIKLDLGTCWVHVGNIEDDLKKETFGQETVNVQFLLAFGREKRRNPFNERPFSVKRGVEELVYDGEIEKFFTVEDLENKGLMDLFYYVRFAPSTKNLQPWRFLIKDGKVDLLIRYKEWYNSILIDAGIVMYYFEELAHYDGMDSMWEIVDFEKVDLDEYTYKKIAEYKL